ncbi:MAG: Maf family protein [Micropepsaceae bacterium]
MTGLILASGSVTRLEMLRQAGVAVTVERANVDEASAIESLMAEKAKPRDIADFLAELKAVRVSAQHPGAMVIGADQVLSLGTRIFQKPSTRAVAREHLLALRGQTHVLSSAVCVSRDGNIIWREVREARLTMRDFSDRFVDDYLQQAGEEILGSVGAYQVEKLGVQLFSRIEGDHFTILGLPLIPLLEFLRSHGILIA